MRLIDADAFRQRMYHEAFETDTDMQKWDSGCWIRYKLFENCIDELPTLSPDEVRGVGEWLPHPNPQFVEVDVCSVCGIGTRKMYHCTDGVQTWDEKTFFRYCPWCGAKMKGAERKP